MRNFSFNNPRTEQATVPRGIITDQPIAKAFMSGVFSWMFTGLGITALVAYLFAHNPAYMELLINSETGSMSMLGWIVMFAPIGFVLAMGLGYNRFSSTVLVALYLGYALVMGMSLSFIFLAYTGSSIFSTFIIASAMFGFMAFLGYTTKMDLTKFGSIMMMGVVGIVIASLVNMFMKSGTLDYIISFAGVLLFTGLTAYDTQKLKNIGSNVEYRSEAGSKLAVLGALTLYIDFINLFLFLLRFLGKKNE